MASGMIFKAARGLFYVKTQDETLCCKTRGKLRLEDIKPLVGDRVEVTPTEPGYGVITRIHERQNAFVRPSVANIDALVIIASGAIPVTQPVLIDRMTALASKNNCASIICVNKCDIDPGDELFGIYKKSGFLTIKTSAETGQGIPELRCAIKGKLCAFTGNSGVGKSSVLNMLSDGVNADVGDISKKLGRGRHTTRHVELFTLPNDAIIADTPGFSSFSTELELTDREQVQHYFPEFEPYLGNCRFLDCAHINEPDCAVLAALNSGLIQKSRHSSYKLIYEEAEKYNEWEHKAIQ